MCEKAWSMPFVTIHWHPENLHLGMQIVQKMVVEVVEGTAIYNFPIHHLVHFCYEIVGNIVVNSATLK
jgi:hypothetical protein